MHADQAEKWAQLQQFDFDDSAAEFSFTQRLAKENGWRLAFATRVVEEYRRFLALAALADHPVSPPDTIDQAWHLHLLYTRSYWEKLCRNILGFPLHHEPTRGGREEQQKFATWYQRTLNAYRDLFQEDPPRDIWPSPRELQRSSAKHQRVNLSRYWLLQRLHVSSWLRRWGWTPLMSVVAIAFPWPIVLANWNVLDWHGPDFLRFYIPLAVVGVVISFLTRFLLLGSSAASAVNMQELSLTADETAMLAGGTSHAVGAAVGALVQQGALMLQPLPKSSLQRREVFMISLGNPCTQPVSPLQEELLRLVKQESTVQLRELRHKLQYPLETVREHLDALGLTYRQSDLRFAAVAALIPVLVIFPLGLMKIYTGLQRHKPIEFLLITTVVYFVINVLLVAMMNHFRTKTGSALLNSLRKEHAALEPQAQTQMETVDPQTMGYALGLFGFSMLAAGPAAQLGDYFHSPHRRFDGTWTDAATTNPLSSSCSSGCGSSCGAGTSCGSSCGGGDGGGSGCGGCGGGGGD